jgi:hypothetical protein
LFDRCVQAVEARGGAYDPKAVCAAAGRKKYGQAEMSRRAAAGRRRAARAHGNPESKFTYQVQRVKGEFVGREPFYLLKEMRGKRLVRQWGGTRAEMTDLKARHLKAQREHDKALRRLEGRKKNIGSERRRPPHLRLGSQTERCGLCAWFDPQHHACNMYGAYPVKATQMCDDFERGTPGTKYNPADGAAAAYEEFHGRPSTEVVEVTERVHHHAHLPAAGELRGLKIEPVKGSRYVELSGFGGAILAFNEKKSQLFIKGGDQSVDLKKFGITREPHEVETLGKVIDIDYFTQKDHLGKDGGRGVYRHKFRTTNENGRHVTVRVAEYPDAIYYVLDEHIVFSGGSYEIIPEGIDK